MPGIVPAIFDHHRYGNFGMIHRCPANKQGVIIVDGVAIFIAHRDLGRTGFAGNADTGNAHRMAGAGIDAGFHPQMHRMHGFGRNMQIYGRGIGNRNGLARLRVNEGLGDLGLHQIAAIGEGRNGADQL